MSRGAGVVGVSVAYTPSKTRPAWWKLIDFTPFAGVTATADATPHVLGPWTELFASTTAETDLLHIATRADLNINGFNTGILADIGIGAAAAEVAVFPSITFGSRSINSDAGTFVPVRIPKGSRVAIRCQGVQASETLPVRVATFQTGLPAALSAVSLGAITADSTGVVLAVDNTWTQIVAATAEPYEALGCSVGYASTVAGSATVTTIEWGVGAAGSEVVVGKTSGVGSTNESWAQHQLLHPILVNIPAGTRIAARRTGGATAVNVTTHGVRKE